MTEPFGGCSCALRNCAAKIEIIFVSAKLFRNYFSFEYQIVVFCNLHDCRNQHTDLPKRTCSFAERNHRKCREWTGGFVEITDNKERADLSKAPCLSALPHVCRKWMELSRCCRNGWRFLPTVVEGFSEFAENFPNAVETIPIFVEDFPVTVESWFCILLCFRLLHDYAQLYILLSVVSFFYIPIFICSHINSFKS